MKRKVKITGAEAVQQKIERSSGINNNHKLNDKGRGSASKKEQKK